MNRRIAYWLAIASLLLGIAGGTAWTGRSAVATVKQTPVTDDIGDALTDHPVDQFSLNRVC